MSHRVFPIAADSVTILILIIIMGDHMPVGICVCVICIYVRVYMCVNIINVGK